MRRYLLTAAVAVLGLAASHTPAFALRIAAPPQPAQMAIHSPVVVVGKVTAIEKDTVDATSPFVGAKDSVAYKVAVVKIDGALAGADNLTHIKIGFVPPVAAPNPNPPVGGVRPPIIRRGPQMPEIKEGQELLLFLAKHPTGDFYVVPGMNYPVDVSTDAGKKTLEQVKRVTVVLADPAKGLKSEKAAERTDAAILAVMKYRSYPVLGGEAKDVAIPADESKLILKALAEANWSLKNQGGAEFSPNAFVAFNQLGLADKDGWKPVIAQAKPGQPPVDYAAATKEAFVKWLAGPGKDYQIKKVVAK